MVRSLQTQEDFAVRIKGVVGWLLTEPSFLAAVDDLRGQWQTLPVDGRPSFPLRRPIPYVPGDSPDKSSAQTKVLYLSMSSIRRSVRLPLLWQRFLTAGT
jgi:hypothetical protein